MKKILFLCMLALGLFTGKTYAQLTIREIEDKAPEVKRDIIWPYDTLSNMKMEYPMGKYKRYIGQDIFFYPRSKGSRVDVFYYGNFRLLSPDTLPDMAWIKKRKNPKPRDYYRKHVLSDVYKAKYVEEQIVCFGNRCPSGVYNSSRSGYFTPYQAIEGKTFRIIGCEEIKQSFGRSKDLAFTFTLADSLGTMLLWENAKLETSTLYSDTYEYSNSRHKYSDSRYKTEYEPVFPTIIVSYLEKMQRQYVGKSFFPKESSTNYLAKNIKRGGKYTELKGEIKCIDLSLVGDINAYLVPKLIFEDSEGEVFAIDITKAPDLYWYLKRGYDRIEVVENREVSPYDLVPSEIIYEQRRKQEEERLAEEQRKREEKEKREREMFTKYKNRETAKLIADGQIRIGWTKEMCMESWGAPQGINKTTDSRGAHEQWIYYKKNCRLHFENGKLITIKE